MQGGQCPPDQWWAMPTLHDAFAVQEIDRERSSMAERRPHKPQGVGSNPTVSHSHHLGDSSTGQSVGLRSRRVRVQIPLPELRGERNVRHSRTYGYTNSGIAQPAEPPPFKRNREGSTPSPRIVR